MLQFPALAKIFLKGARTDKIRLVPFFIRTCIEPRFAQFSIPPYIPVTHDHVDAQPFLQSCPLFTQPNPLVTKVFRRLCTSRHLHPPRPLTVKKWLLFWQFPIVHMARNVWYRVLLNKLACRSNLHRFMPTLVSTPTCITCPLSITDTDHHFLFECPLKLTVWKGLWPSFFDVPFSTALLKQALLELVFPRVSSNNPLPPSVCIGHTLLAIWRSHFNSVFHAQPFRSSIVISLARSLLLTSFREQLIRLGQTPFPLPHFSIEPSLLE